MSDTDGDTVLVFAAVSLSDSLSEVGGAFREETGTDVTFNFAGSQTLAQQIAASGRGDLFISADEEWMDFIAAKEHLEAGSRISLLSNRLVLVSAAAAEFRVDRLEDLCSLDFEFLCIGDPDAVPAGRYARKWFEQERCGDGETLWEGAGGGEVITRRRRGRRRRGYPRDNFSGSLSGSESGLRQGQGWG